jgi:hypothetical protein
MFCPSIPVTVTRNPRARRVWLKMRTGLGLEIVLPSRVATSEIPGILERHQAWITERLAELRTRGEAPGQNPLPRRIHLAFLGREFRVDLEEGARPALHDGQESLRLLLPADDVPAGAFLLQRWLVAQGKNHLVSFCRELAGRHGIPVSGIRIGNQSGRWGSCSPRLTISLNARLLLLPRALAQNVVLHELCHVRHRNHGPAFWSALRALDPLTDTHEELLRQAWAELPAWCKWPVPGAWPGALFRQS